MAKGKFEAQNQSQIVETTLDLLDVVAEDTTVTQRGIAEQLGIALGLTNAVLKRCVKKGLLKIHQAPARRYAYYLTPQGFAEKSRLTAEYLGYSLTFFRTARREYADVFSYCGNRGWSRVALVGATDLAEIAYLATLGTGIEVVGVIDTARNTPNFCGLPVFRDLAEIDPAARPEAVVLSSIEDAQGYHERLLEEMPPERVIVPKLLRVTTRTTNSRSDKTSAGGAP
jgi:DNA-binding MarR family transcriptional regulator